MNDEILNTITKDTFTLTLLKHRLRILKSNLLKKIFGSEAPAEQLSVQEANWLSSLPASFYQKFNKDNVYQIFDAIETKINSMPVLLIYIAFEADDQTIYQIGMNLKKSFTSITLFDIKVNPALIAGCALSFGGIYRDYSLKAKIEDKKSEILESFKKFLR
ncbi:F0F1 ATP synthase subunit delta [Candidatus Daviesbacteria bacterium]|nr:F0F1 ATP synthase subunit delta [Candidatus Daviesbacteria bacterium]